MSPYYYSYEEEDAYRNGRGDANCGRFDHRYDCHFGDDVDKAYCDGHKEVEEEREEERSREIEEEERQSRWRWEAQQERMRQQEEEEARYYDEEQERQQYADMQRAYQESLEHDEPVPPSEPDSVDFNTWDKLPF